MLWDYVIWLSGAPQASRPANFSPSSPGCAEATAAFGNGEGLCPAGRRTTDCPSVAGCSHCPQMTLPFVQCPTGKQEGPLPLTPSGLSLTMVLMHPQHPWDLNQQIRVKLKTMTREFPNSLPLCIYLFFFPAVFPFSPFSSLSTTTSC